MDQISVFLHESVFEGALGNSLGCANLPDSHSDPDRGRQATYRRRPLCPVDHGGEEYPELSQLGYAALSASSEDPNADLACSWLCRLPLSLAGEGHGPELVGVATSVSLRVEADLP